GPSARGACVGDEIIIVCYALTEDSACGFIEPKIIKVNDKNRIKD
ncbi:MAG: aspartate 1-decarboxylase, partial [Candidatus Omnitrophica bacterium]|nr:aspartate 1-decarboxylase [Candidatus Omnitrophota bacterium]